jgi:hypothetical protein
MIIRAKTFRAWFMANLKDRASDIASHGADCGYYGLTYNSDGAKLFDRFGDELWDMLYEEKESLGEPSIPAMMANFGRRDMCDTLDSFKMLVVWFAAERIAREITEETED